MNFLFYFQSIFIGLVVLACVSQPPVTEPTQIDDGDSLPVGRLLNRAEYLYDKSLREGSTNNEAAEEAAKFLESQPAVKEAHTTSSDSVRVVFKDGREAVLLFGKKLL